MPSGDMTLPPFIEVLFMNFLPQGVPGPIVAAAWVWPGVAARTDTRHRMTTRPAPTLTAASLGLH